MQRRLALHCLAAGLASGVATRPAIAQAQGSGAEPPGGLRPLGRGTMRFLGFTVYEARLWVGPGFQAEAYERTPLALELHYHRAFKAEAIAERSLQEMRRVGTFTDAQSGRWLAALQTALPGVAAGDRRLGLHHPGQGAEFRHGAQPTGRVDEPEFSRLFFGIWLAPQTSAPDLRRALLAAAP